MSRLVARNDGTGRILVIDKSRETQKILYQSDFLPLKRDGLSRAPYQLSPCGKWFAYECADAFIDLVLYDVEKGEVKWCMNRHDGFSICCICFSDDGTKVASGAYDDSIFVTDVASGKVLNAFNLKDDSSRPRTFNVDGNLVVGYDVTTALCFGRLDGDSGAILITGNQRREIKVWRLSVPVVSEEIGAMQDIEPRVFLEHDRAISAIAVSQDNMFISGDGKGVLKWCHVSPSAITCLCSTHQHTDMVRSIRIHDNFVLSSGDDSKTVLWDRWSGAPLKVMIEESATYCSEFINDDTVLTATLNGTVRLWNTNDGLGANSYGLGANSSIACIHIGHRAVSSTLISREGITNVGLICGDIQSIRLFGVEQGDLKFQIRYAGYPPSLSMDGRILIAASWSGDDTGRVTAICLNRMISS